MKNNRLLPPPLIAMRFRRAFTLIELLVSISIIAVLMSFILPAIQSSREAARRIQCANHLRNVTVAMQGWVTTFERFPAAGYWGGDAVLDKTNQSAHHNWVVELLPYLDRQDLADRWDHSLLMSDSPNAELAEFHLPILVCPSDFTTNDTGDLSFALNGGIGESLYRGGVHDCITDPFYNIIDLNGNGQTCLPLDADEASPSDREIYYKLGLFFNENYQYERSPGYEGTSRHHRPGTVIDGMSNTLMVVENVRTGFDPHRNTVNLATWATADASRNRVYFGHQVCQGNVCSDGKVDLSKANFGNQAINSGLDDAEGESPWPNSAHPGGVNAAFADGRVQFLSESIDGKVYMNLFTPQGSRLQGLALDAGIASGNF